MFQSMAIPKIRATYSLDVETVELLEGLARRWKTSKSEALRRLIRRGADDSGEDPTDKIAALKALQSSVGLTREAADRWVREVRAVRRASGVSRMK
jgi:hypothetical protein